ncbi:putative transporter y4wD [Nymphon striatum]|nr:putative transporter y4wD [Nymphon striatum]
MAMALAPVVSRLLGASEMRAKSRRPLMNLNHAIFSFAYASSALFAGFAREIGLTPFQVFAILFLVTMVLILGMGGSDGRSDDTHEGGASQSKLSWMLLAPAGAIVLIAFMTEQATEGWSALHLERNLGAGAAMGALGPAILGLTMGVGRLSGQFMAAHYSEAFVIRVAAVLAAFGTTLAAISPSLWMAYLGFAILGLGVSVVAPMAFAWIGRVVPDRHRVQAISRVAVIGYAGFFIGPPLMGFLSEGFGLNTSFAAIAIILLIVPVVLVPMLKRRAAIA